MTLPDDLRRPGSPNELAGIVDPCTEPFIPWTWENFVPCFGYPSLCETGACCDGLTCYQTDIETCVAAGHAWHGNGSQCTEGLCGSPPADPDERGRSGEVRMWPNGEIQIFDNFHFNEPGSGEPIVIPFGDMLTAGCDPHWSPGTMPLPEFVECCCICSIDCEGCPFEMTSSFSGFDIVKYECMDPEQCCFFGPLVCDDPSFQSHFMSSSGVVPICRPWALPGWILCGQAHDLPPGPGDCFALNFTKCAWFSGPTNTGGLGILGGSFDNMDVGCFGENSPSTRDLDFPHNSCGVIPSTPNGPLNTFSKYALWEQSGCSQLCTLVGCNEVFIRIWRYNVDVPNLTQDWKMIIQIGSCAQGSELCQPPGPITQGCFPCSGCNLSAEFEFLGAHLCDCVPTGDWDLVSVVGDIGEECGFMNTAVPTFSIQAGTGRTWEEVRDDPFP